MSAGGSRTVNVAKIMKAALRVAAGNTASATVEGRRVLLMMMLSSTTARTHRARAAGLSGRRQKARKATNRKRMLPRYQVMETGEAAPRHSARSVQWVRGTSRASVWPSRTTV